MSSSSSGTFALFHSQSPLRNAAGIFALTTLFYFIGAQLRLVESLSMFWPLNGVMAGVFARYAYLNRLHYYAISYIAMLLYDLMTTQWGVSSLGINLSNMVFIVTVALLVQRDRRLKNRTPDPVNALRLFNYCLLAALLCAIVGAVASGAVSNRTFWPLIADFFPILSVLVEQQRSPWLMGLLAANAFIWPTIAYWRARRSAAPLRAEHQNLVLDAGAGGFWIAMMAANPLPSVAIATILLADRLAAGGFPLMRKAGAVMLAVFMATWLTQGMALFPQVSQRTMYATLPLIGIYTVALSVLTNSIAMRLRFKSRELERIAMMDPLLDIANRRLLEKRIDHELHKLRQTCSDSALMFIDIDNFKEVNDRYGHKVGDMLLVTVSQILHIATRQSDTPARLGGDEFVILLPNTTLDEAHVVATRIMDAAAVIDDVAEEKIPCTMSIGIASATREMGNVTDWLQAADNALYQAKREGKNRIFAH